MPSAHVGHPVAPHRRIRARATPALIDDTGAYAAHRSPQDDEEPPEGLPRATVLHGMLMGITAAVAVWFVVDLVNAIGDPEVISGHLRGALVAAIVALTVTMSNWRLYRRVERLHAKNRATNSWFEARAKVIDQRDANIHQHLTAVAKGVELVARSITDELARTNRAVVEMRRDLVDIAEGLGYSNGSIRRVRQEIASLGGGQAAVAETVDNLARVLARVAERWERLSREEAVEPESGSGEVHRAYLRGEDEAHDSTVVAMPDTNVYDLGKRVGRREALRELGLDHGGTPTS